MAKKLTAFQQAFADARDEGKAEFTFNGKRYTTRRADDPKGVQFLGNKPPVLGEQGERRPGTELKDTRFTYPGSKTKYRYKDETLNEQKMENLMKPYRPRDPNAYYEGDSLRNPEVDIPTFRKGGSVSSASKRADGCAIRGKTRGKMV